MSCVIQDPEQGIQLVVSALGAQSLNHWTTRGSPEIQATCVGLTRCLNSMQARPDENSGETAPKTGKHQSLLTRGWVCVCNGHACS